MIFAAMEDGACLLYEAQADTFIASRQDFTALRGAFAALTDRVFVADNHLLNQSLVPYGALETASGLSSGFTIHDGARACAPRQSRSPARVSSSGWI